MFVCLLKPSQNVCVTARHKLEASDVTTELQGWARPVTRGRRVITSQAGGQWVLCKTILSLTLNLKKQMAVPFLITSVFSHENFPFKRTLLFIVSITNAS